MSVARSAGPCCPLRYQLGTAVLSAWRPTVAVVSSVQACRVQEALSQQELDLLDALPGAANMINFAMLSCELQADHSGPHLALGQMYGGRARWLQWVPGWRHDWLDIADAEHCAAESPLVSDGIPDDRELCLFPALHPGRHSFEIARADA